MTLDRRSFMTRGATIGAAISAGLASLDASASRAFAQGSPIKAIGFDAFVIFDPRSVAKRAKDIFPEHADALNAIWFNKIFGYSWMRTAADRYVSFNNVIDEALAFAARSVKLDLGSDERRTLVNAFSELSVWPDTAKGLESLRAKNIRLAPLSNMTEDMLHANLRRNGIEQHFEFLLSTDHVRAYKPSPKAYAMGLEAFGLPKENIGFAAFGGWDAVGASWFGYPTYWINRADAVVEEPNSGAYTIGRDFSTLLQATG
jgi:2-haloacid dehalogenase